jgi:hypothetical protein
MRIAAAHSGHRGICSPPLPNMRAHGPQHQCPQGTAILHTVVPGMSGRYVPRHTLQSRPCATVGSTPCRRRAAMRYRANSMRTALHEFGKRMALASLRRQTNRQTSVSGGLVVRLRRQVAHIFQSADTWGWRSSAQLSSSSRRGHLVLYPTNCNHFRTWVCILCTLRGSRPRGSISA